MELLQTLAIMALTLVTIHTLWVGVKTAPVVEVE
jgi:hypothetical protein